MRFSFLSSASPNTSDETSRSEASEKKIKAAVKNHFSNEGQIIYPNEHHDKSGYVLMYIAIICCFTQLIKSPKYCKRIDINHCIDEIDEKKLLSYLFQIKCYNISYRREKYFFARKEVSNNSSGKSEHSI